MFLTVWCEDCQTRELMVFGSNGLSAVDKARSRTDVLPKYSAGIKSIRDMFWFDKRQGSSKLRFLQGVGIEASA